MIIATVLSLLCAPLSGQAGRTPPGLATLELERSRSCVGVLARVDALNAVLEPLVTQSQRLLAVAQAVDFEDRTVVDSLNATDPIEAQVREWFLTDGELALQYATQQDASIAETRATGREAIKTTVSNALAEVQEDAESILSQDPELAGQAGSCDGAIFVRSAVLESCQTETSPLCDEAVGPASESARFRFVDSAEDMWGIEEMRPWTIPSALRSGPTGQLDGGRTIGYVRIGNVVISVAFTLLLRNRDEATPEELQSYQTVNDSLGLAFSHPSLVFTPALGIRVGLPNRLADESKYIIHFGDQHAPDIVWTGDAGTGNPIEGMVPLSVAHVARLQAGDPLALAATRDGGGGVDEPVFGVEFTDVNQAPAAQALLEYMASQMSADLSALVQPPGER